jgi:UDP-N-acetylglucosamine:LPS N-acetylglucosamine transferase
VKALLVCSSGGHLAQLMALRPWWQRHERVWVTFDTQDARSLLVGERVVWAHSPTTRNIPNLLRNLGVAARVLRAFHPHVVISDGAGVAFPFFLLSWARRVKRVYIEVYDRIDTATLTGRLCYPMSDLFLLQWEEQKRLFPRGIVIGRLI